ncbi:MAG: transglutaminase-like domain-containing protein [Lachnospiraceae bacterium]|nr:transglutaminase-like domain-containing protein [Lachnospiraceae bacterium]
MLKRFLTLTLTVSMILISTFTCAAAESIDVLTEISDISSEPDIITLPDTAFVPADINDSFHLDDTGLNDAGVQAASQYYCNTQYEAYEAVRDIVRRRVNNMALYPDVTNRMNYDTDGYVYDRIYVKKGLISGCIDLMDVYDFEAERPGMKPDEGDYMFHQFRNRIQRVFEYEYPSCIDYYDYDGTTYEVYEIYLPVITTRSEEDEMDAKVSELMNTTFAGVKNGTNTEKIKAVYDYVRKHVKGTVNGSGGSDRTYPLYHTAYHALIKGNGTCEAYAHLFSRLMRELGVASKAIMGTDAAAHAYNIVDGGDGYWYFIDCSTGRYLSDNKSFKRSEEQDMYKSPRFIKNYFDKVKGGTDLKAGKISVIGSDGNEDEFDSLVAACQYIDSKSLVSDADWTIKFNSDCILGGDADDISLSHPERVSIDLNGHNLKCKYICFLSASKISNGTVCVGYSDKVFTYSGNLSLDYIKEVKNVVFTGVTDLDHLLFNVYSCQDMILDNTTFKKLPVYYGDNMDPYAQADYSLYLNNTVTLENSSFYLLNKTGKNHPVIISKSYDNSGRLLRNGRLLIKGTTAFGANSDDIKSPIPKIEFATSGKGYFESGDVVAVNSGTIKRVTDSSGTLANAQFKDVFDIVSTGANKNPADTSLDLCEVDSSLIFAKPAFALYNGEEPVSTFIKWSEAVNYIDNTVKDKNASYRIELIESVDMAEKLVFPKTAAKITLASAGADRYSFGFTGDLSPSTDTSFQNINLVSDSSGAKLTIGGNTVEFTDSPFTTSKGSFASISGKAGSHLILMGTKERMPMTVAGNINAGNITADNADITSANGNISVSNLLSLKSASINAAANVTLKNVASLNEYNSISYGDKKGKCKISGSMKCSGPNVKAVSGSGREVIVNRFALSITPKFLKGDYTSAASKKSKIITAAKVPAGCFVIARTAVEDDRITVSAFVKKAKDTFGISSGDDIPVTLCIKNDSEDLTVLGSFDTVNNALGEIALLCSNETEYSILIDPSSDTASDFKTNLVTPKQAAGITIASKTDEKAVLKVKNSIALNSPLTLDGVILADYINTKGVADKKTRINLKTNASHLTMKNVDFSTYRIGSIKGNGASKASTLEVLSSGTHIADSDFRYKFEVNGDINGIGNLLISDVGLYCKGKINVGNVHQDELAAELGGTCKIKRSNGLVKSVASKITINGEITQATDKGGLKLALLTMDNGTCINFLRSGQFESSDPVFNQAKPAFQLLKAPAASTDGFALSIDDEDSYNIIKSNGSFYLTRR